MSLALFLAFLVVLLVLVFVYGLCAAMGLETPDPRDPVIGRDQYRAEAQERRRRPREGDQP